MTVRIDLEYDGTDFYGWARQPGKRTVEEELAAALGRILSSEITLTVAGRTDRGVHATGQVASYEGRVVRADGSLSQGERQAALLAAEAVPLTGDPRRVDVRLARWWGDVDPA